MNKKFVLGSIVFSFLAFWACTEKAVSKSQFIFKEAPNKNAVAKFKDKVITHDELYGDIKHEIYDLEKKIFDLKMNKLKAILLKTMMESDPKYKGLTNDEYLNKYIAKNINISSKEIMAFAKERRIPDNQLNDQIKDRIKTFLMAQKKQKEVENWMNKQLSKNPAEVYLTKPKAPIVEIAAGDSPFAGKADAKVTLIEFSDFECPFCSKGAKIVDQLKKKYGNKLKVVFKNFPLPFHKNAMNAANAALCANEQDSKKFWKMHDHLFENQSKLDEKSLEEAAKKVGLDMAKYKECYASKRHQNKIEADKKLGQDSGVKSTPTFFVNGRMVSGAVPVDKFSEIIDEELKK
jgi:protein-disulfide isomerase